MDVCVRHVLPISPDDYWQTLYASRPFIEALYTEGLGGSDLLISAWQTHEGGAFERVLSFTPKMQAPKAVKRVLGEAFRCEERGSFDPLSKTWRFDYLNSKLANKLKLKGSLSTLDHPEGCEVVCTLSATVSIWGWPPGGEDHRFAIRG